MNLWAGLEIQSLGSQHRPDLLTALTRECPSLQSLLLQGEDSSPEFPWEGWALPAPLRCSLCGQGRVSGLAHLPWGVGVFLHSSGPPRASLGTGGLPWHWNFFFWGIRPADVVPARVFVLCVQCREKGQETVTEQRPGAGEGHVRQLGHRTQMLGTRAALEKGRQQWSQTD